ncbi:MarR family winged helix-turn-helix transcriptional regulator [Clostridium aminobutyricum]|uniref:MarR family transcriptional regulator n=1 Tax=Clostridium aminobutyricum TaxID=33953 RepID=A0A939D6S9_CLOAM|nr:MarR family transcriptional regulator [Clostridium aminobutyricum]MBN7772292.1 MarR family transcriptional regulator [Clostridium aminobutyricum]
MSDHIVDLIEQFTRVEWLLHRYHQQNHSHHGPMGDPTRGQGRVLAILKIKPEISQKELSYLLDMTPQSLGEFLSKLEKSGYITRTPSETDRRAMMIKLTESGSEATDQEFSFAKLFECLNEEEQNNLSNYLDRIIQTLEAELDERSQTGFNRNIDEHSFREHFGAHRNWPGHGGFGGEQDDPRFRMGRNPMDRGHGFGRKQNPTPEEE